MTKRWTLVILVLLLSGCATGLKREGQCLASLTGDVLVERQEIDVLETDWRTALRLRDEPHLRAVVHPNRLSGIPLGTSSRGPDLQPALLLGPSGKEPEPALHLERAAYQRLAEARSRHRLTMQWYERLYDRVRARQEEDEILSQARVVLLTGPGLLLYPVIHWNVHSVFWDGQDPDAETDEITRFCRQRVEAEGASREKVPPPAQTLAARPAEASD